MNGIILDEKTCTGCMSCFQSCPKSCIYIKEDDLGNYYPIIDSDKCINCGKCKRSCPEAQKLDFNEVKKAFAVYSLDNACRNSSTSGGAAAEFYKQAVLNGYWICGAKFDKDYHVVHALSRSDEIIKDFKKSKYVYSETGTIYQEIKKLLDNGEKVLFISLPCKVAGLLGFLGRKYGNLITIDIVCHGTPSYKNLRDHIKRVDPKRKSTTLQFRCDNEYYFKLSDDKGKCVYQRKGKTDTYIAAFLEGLNSRNSCYRCSYAKPERISDITICDFWGLGVEIPFNHPYTGAISAVLLNTAKGDDFFETCKHRFFIEERPVDEAVSGNAQLNAPTKVHPKRKEFEKMYIAEGFETAVSKCLGNEMNAAKKEIRKQRIKRFARQAVKLVIKRHRG